MNRREFHFTDGTSNKFWAVGLNDKNLTVHFGRIGTAGQAQEKTFPTAEAAKKEHDKLIAEKTKKGYVEVSSGASSAATPVPVVKKAAEAKPRVAPDAVAAPVSASAGKKAVVEGSVSEATATELQAGTPPVSPAPCASTIERRVRVSDADRAMVSWLWRQLPPPALKPFDYEACIQTAKRWYSSHSVGYGVVVTHEAEIPLRMSREEAWFWARAYHAGTERSRYGGLDWMNRNLETAEAWEKILRAATADVAPPANPDEEKKLRRMMEAAGHGEQWISVVAAFFPPVETAERLIDANLRQIATGAQNYYNHPHFDMAGAYADRVLNFEGEEVRQKLREVMARRFAAETDRESPAAQLALAFLSLVGGGAELEGYLRSHVPTPSPNYWPTNCLNLRTLAGLPDEESFVRETARLGIQIDVPSAYQTERQLKVTRLWLAATEWRHIDFVVKAVVQGTSKDDVARMARLLHLVEAPEAAPAMLEVQLRSKAPAVAAEWFEKNPLHAVVGLAPVAMGSGRSAEAARDVLLHFRRSGRVDVLNAAIRHLPANVGAWLVREIVEFAEDSLPEATRADLPAPLVEAFAGLKAAKAPSWLQVTSLPPIKFAGKRLAPAEVELVLAALKDATLGGDEAAAKTPPPLLSLLKQHADPVSLDAFAWKLFSQWIGMGAASKDKWALGAVGHLGNDASVLKLTPMIREWPGESQHQRAVFGLEVLRVIGTDTALMSLNGIAQKLKFQGLKEKAKVMMEGIAQARGFTREQLADRIVPDCGLDADGGRVFDFGPRQFRFVLGSEMKPLVRDASGKVKPDLPSPNGSDDAEKAAAAVAEWKLLKKTLKEALKIQSERLEDAMITGRRWTPEEFETLIVKHPLMVNLARQLVFGVYSGKGPVARTFRITEDQSLADENDDPCELPREGAIGVVHPAHLSDAVKSAWGQVLGDYEIIPPFQQLGREICRAEPEDLEKTEITRYKGPKIPGITVYGMLERSHWLRDTPADGGGFMQHSKYFPSADLTAFIQYTGMGIGYYEEEQEIESVYFVPGHIEPEWWGTHTNKLKIKDVDAVTISEVLRLVRAIMAKAA